MTRQTELALTAIVGLRRSVSAVLLLLGTGGAVWGQEGAKDPWKAAAQQLLDEAYVGFSEGTGDDEAAGPQALFGQAAVLLNLQPTTDGHVDQAIALLENIMADHPGTGVALEAEYLRARAEQVHKSRPDLGKARDQFIRFIEANPGHRLADVAAVKLATLEIWSGTNGEQTHAIQRWNGVVDSLGFDAARKDLHLLLAEADQHVTGNRENALHHFLKAEELGIASHKTRGNVIFQIAELAYELGRNDVAREFYERFLNEYRRDVRRPVIESRLKDLAGAGGVS
ncbi:MAG: tetratricopeptide repeat protein [Chthoniobacterales bacterium]